jgi:hypothetical protein
MASVWCEPTQHFCPEFGALGVPDNGGTGAWWQLDGSGVVIPVDAAAIK